MTTTVMSLEQIRRTGLDALAKALGPIDLVRFLQLYETGPGDYSNDRHQWLAEESLDDVVADVMEDQEDPD
jgi:hypothetical protein